LHHERQRRADEDEAPRQVARHDALDDDRHQRALGRRELLAADRTEGGVVQAQDREADDEHRDQHADHEADLLLDRRGADQVAGLEILGGGAGVRRGDADDGADAQGGALVGVAAHAQRHEDERRAE
jgi:hypothetical protein